jgi:hypothetical protein
MGKLAFGETKPMRAVDTMYRRCHTGFPSRAGANGEYCYCMVLHDDRDRPSHPRNGTPGNM